MAVVRSVLGVGLLPTSAVDKHLIGAGEFGGLRPILSDRSVTSTPFAFLVDDEIQSVHKVRHQMDWRTKFLSNLGLKGVEPRRQTYNPIKCSESGCTNNSKYHGKCRTHATPGWHSWMNMLRRCAKGGHPRYAGRGIKVCKRWLYSFENFIADMGPRPSPKHSIERMDNNGNYTPGNCKWATSVEQMNNTCRSKRKI